MLYRIKTIKAQKLNNLLNINYLTKLKHMKNINLPTFHIPVMGIGYTIDTPMKVAQYGVSSAISLVDDKLMEKLRKFYSEKLGIPFQEISEKVNDFRAKRITAYLDMVNEVVSNKFEELKNSFQGKSTEIEKYMEMLPDFAGIKQRFNKFTQNDNIKDIQKWIKSNLSIGSIDVNIMTKLDKENYLKGEKLPTECNDAHAALRGFAKSKLHSSVILSAGMNPRLYSYIEQFSDFYPDENYKLNKKIIIKVSDYRSALIQGKFFAKKGLWVSEYRIESGLNCGGHAFATNGFLMGPILEEFKNERENLIQTTHELYSKVLEEKGLNVPNKALEVKITAQGGVGTSEEHNFLLEQYEVDSVGWGTPFLLVPEVVNMDNETETILKEATEKDLYLSDISPLGVPFNSVRGNTKDAEKYKQIEKGIYGSPCSNKYLSFNNEHTNKPVCTASRAYQKKCIASLDEKHLESEEYKKEVEKLTHKSCICVGLGTSALIANDIDTKKEGNGVSVCPSSTIAHFSETYSLKNMAKHIYGKVNLLNKSERKNMFVKELSMYVDYFKNMVGDITAPLDKKQQKTLNSFKGNLNKGIEYYKGLFSGAKLKYEDVKNKIGKDIEKLEKELNQIKFPSF